MCGEKDLPYIMLLVGGQLRRTLPGAPTTAASGGVQVSREKVEIGLNVIKFEMLTI